MFVRTKDGIYKDLTVGYCGMIHFCNNGIRVAEEEIIKESDTIEELIDEFMIMENNCCLEMFSNYNNLKNSGWYRSDIDIYGAIYTDKGLIFIAKMNENGGLELI